MEVIEDCEFCPLSLFEANTEIQFNQYSISFKFTSGLVSEFFFHYDPFTAAEQENTNTNLPEHVEDINFILQTQTTGVSY